MLHWCGDGSNNFENALSSNYLTGIHNSSMGDLDLIIRQISKINHLNPEREKEIVYISSMLMPNSKHRVNELLNRQKEYRGVLNFIFLSLDGYGLSFDNRGRKGGYIKMEDDPIEIINEFTRTQKK